MTRWPDSLLYRIHNAVKRCKCKQPCNHCWVWPYPHLYVTNPIINQAVNVRIILTGMKNPVTICSHPMCVRLKHLVEYHQYRTRNKEAPHRLHLMEIVNHLLGSEFDDWR